VDAFVVDDIAGVEVRGKARQRPITDRRIISDQEIVERSIYALVNEGARALEAGAATRASDIDVISVTGYGFPTWRGGPMFHADRVGLSAVLDRIAAFHEQHGERWRPAPLLESLVLSGRTFRWRDRMVRPAPASS
jgi:3-hydroxyacyl-CoA dehydrogenase